MDTVQARENVSSGGAPRRSTKFRRADRSINRVLVCGGQKKQRQKKRPLTRGWSLHNRVVAAQEGRVGGCKWVHCGNRRGIARGQCGKRRNLFQTSVLAATCPSGRGASQKKPHFNKKNHDLYQTPPPRQIPKKPPNCSKKPPSVPPPPFVQKKTPIDVAGRHQQAHKIGKSEVRGLTLFWNPVAAMRPLGYKPTLPSPLTPPSCTPLLKLVHPKPVPTLCPCAPPKHVPSTIPDPVPQP